MSFLRVCNLKSYNNHYFKTIMNSYRFEMIILHLPEYMHDLAISKIKSNTASVLKVSHPNKTRFSLWIILGLISHLFNMQSFNFTRNLTLPQKCVECFLFHIYKGHTHHDAQVCVLRNTLIWSHFIFKYLIRSSLQSQIYVISQI